MIQDDDCLHHYGDPKLERNMVSWKVPDEVRFDPIPKKIYCNRDLVDPLLRALRLVKVRGLQDEIKSWDGCFNIRLERGSEHRWSIHSWGLAFDINAFENKLGTTPTMSPLLVKCFTDAGLDWGGAWKRKDGMHFQLHQLPDVLVAG